MVMVMVMPSRGLATSLLTSVVVAAWLRLCHCTFARLGSLRRTLLLRATWGEHTRWLATLLLLWRTIAGLSLLTLQTRQRFVGWACCCGRWDTRQQRHDAFWRRLCAMRPRMYVRILPMAHCLQRHSLPLARLRLRRLAPAAVVESALQWLMQSSRWSTCATQLILTLLTLLHTLPMVEQS